MVIANKGILNRLWHYFERFKVEIFSQTWKPTTPLSINGMYKSGKIQDAKVLFSRLGIQGFQPDFYIYTTLIVGLCKE
jgi:hypothetical protein